MKSSTLAQEKNSKDFPYIRSLIPSAVSIDKNIFNSLSQFKVPRLLPNLCLELTGLKARLSSQLGLQKHTQLFLNNQLLPAIQVGR